MAEFTIFGAGGFIGHHLSSALEAGGHTVRRVDRAHWPRPGEDLAHVVYAIGLTADFRSRPVEIARAHVGVLADVVSNYTYSSFLYLSSTRVYIGADVGREDARITIDPARPDDFYSLTKLTGEALCLAIASPGVRVVRLSNVTGPGASLEVFLPSLIAEARSTGQVVIRTTPDSRKDYIDVHDAVRLIPLICLSGRHRCYNLASGVSVSNQKIAELLRQRLDVPVLFAKDAQTVTFPDIRTDRLIDEFGFRPTPFETSFDSLIESMQDGNTNDRDDRQRSRNSPHMRRR